MNDEPFRMILRNGPDCFAVSCITVKYENVRERVARVMALRRETSRLHEIGEALRIQHFAKRRLTLFRSPA